MGGQRVSSSRASDPALTTVVRSDPRRRRAGAAVPWRRVLVGVVVAALVGGALVATAGVLVSQRIAEGLAVRNATVDTATLARAVVEPALDDALVDERASAAERRAARDQLADAVRTAVRGNGAVRAKMWSPDGTIVWSDEPRLIGERFALSEDDLDALRTDRSDADVSDLDEPENRYERGRGPLLEAYQAVHTPAGDPLLFEVYYRYDDVLASAARLRSAFAGLAFGTVGLVLVLLVPIVLGLLLRIRDGQRERERLLVRALDAQSDERRRIAADLHDGPVQDVAGLALSFGAAARSGSAADAAAADALRSATASLRSSLSAIQPSAPDRGGLTAALDDACARARAAGIETVIGAAPDLVASPGALRTVVRFVREAVANAVRHAGARSIRISVVQDGGGADPGTGTGGGASAGARRATADRPEDLVVRVVDDGVGFDPAVLEEDRPGHLGTTLLRQLATDTGGSLTVRTAPNAGTEWELRLPADTEVIW